MNISIRNHIFGNFKDSNQEDIRMAIEDAVKDEEEITLPGLGVFFEVLWTVSSEDEKNIIIKKLHNKLKKNN